MSSEYAMITDVITLTPDKPVDAALETLKKNRIRAAPVVDKAGKMVGMFSHKHILANLLPVSVTMDDGLQNLDFVIGAAPGISKRLHRLKTMKVSDVTDQKVVVIHPHTPVWETIRLLVKYGSPLPVIDSKSGALLGIVTEQSAMDQLHTPEKEPAKKAAAKKKKAVTKKD